MKLRGSIGISYFVTLTAQQRKGLLGSKHAIHGRFIGFVVEVSIIKLALIKNMPDRC
jgi:hypothetical protein